MRGCWYSIINIMHMEYETLLNEMCPHCVKNTRQLSKIWAGIVAGDGVQTFNDSVCACHCEPCQLILENPNINMC